MDSRVIYGSRKLVAEEPRNDLKGKPVLILLHANSVVEEQTGRPFLFQSKCLALNMPSFSQRSLTRLEGVHPDLVRLMKAAIADSPIDFSIDYGVRSAETQKKLYSYGRTVVNPDTGALPGKPMGMQVTTKDGVIKKSEHQVKSDGFGHAVDIYPYYNGSMQTKDINSLLTIAKHIKKKAQELGLKIVWGGDWKNPYDPPHFQI